jgi:hypothetical protein
MTSCSSITDEPFIVATDDASMAAMRAAGLTDDAYRTCLLGAADDYAAWKTTASDFPFNPFRSTDSGGSFLIPDVTVAVMNAWRTQMSPRGVLSNHDLGTSIGNKLAPVVERMQALGPVIEFQLFGPSVADVDAAVSSGAAMGGRAIELWNTTLPTFTADQLTAGPRPSASSDGACRLRLSELPIAHDLERSLGGARAGLDHLGAEARAR